jgi:WD40 repeat protein
VPRTLLVCLYCSAPRAQAEPPSSRASRVPHTVPVSSVSYSSDGQCVLVGCLDSAVRLLARDTGELMGTYVCVCLLMRLSRCLYASLQRCRCRVVCVCVFATHSFFVR